MLEGQVKSCITMSEPGVPSNDATNPKTTITFDKESDSYIVNWRKCWISNAGDPTCKIGVVLGLTPNKKKPMYMQHTMILLSKDNKGTKMIRSMTLFGYDSPIGHIDIIFDNVKVPKENIIVGEGRGFEIAQVLLRPGKSSFALG